INALEIRGYATSQDINTPTTATTGAVHVNAMLKSGTDKTSFADSGCLFAVRNNGQTRFLVRGDGVIYSDASHQTYDRYDDAMLALAWEATLSPSQQVQDLFARYCNYNETTLVEADLITPLDAHGRRFMNVPGLIALSL